MAKKLDKTRPAAKQTEFEELREIGDTLLRLVTPDMTQSEKWSGLPGREDAKPYGPARLTQMDTGELRRRSERVAVFCKDTWRDALVAHMWNGPQCKCSFQTVQSRGTVRSYVRPISAV